ncbi:excinuclease ABC subunit UvrC [Acinetobacter colistiniresistens]|uniref:excinuclease ABC subunit UvrC n=1 Tax=Acinetobacter colistiniresistens TaxID=280145 RepID=UPI000DA24B45|nr:excinuclease ABC subunit UvrC [Acinetobacter colistiniresistens]
MNPNAREHIEKILAHMTQLPGVYKMLGKDGELLYVGKAKNLKNRVSSYFVKTIEHPKTQALVARIYDIESLVVRSETEALLLEQNLIKLHRPPYNIMLRDDKSYVYIFVSSDKPYPRIASGRGKGKHQIGKFFGPYPSAYSARDTLLVLQKLFNVRQCENSYFSQRKRPCLQYQIKRCTAPCVGLISPKDYKEDVDNSIRFLQGDTKELNQELIGKMEQAAEALEFEKAVFYRDRLALLREVQAQQAVFKIKGEADILAIAYQAGVTCVQIMYVRNGRMLGGKSYFPDMLGDDLGQMLSDFMANFYFQVADEVPTELIVNVAVPDQQQLEEGLQQTFNKKVQIKHKVRETRAEWLELAQMNVQHAIKGKLSNHLELNERFHQLEQVVGRPIDRIECFDISHTMGEAPIASCVVFDQGGARKRDYRQFAIQDITGGDDYAAMRQALIRRYKKNMLPDLLLIDGGKGQLHMAMEVMQELELYAFMIGVSKGEGRKPGLETLHFTDGTKIQLPEDHKALHLIQQVRDEAHRFAITKHRAKRDKRRSSSVLEAIPGLGPKRRRDLLTHFGGIQGVLKASENELTLVPGLGEVLARTIYKILHE